MNGLLTASSPAATRNAAPMATALAPRRWRRSGPSTLIRPDAIAGSITSHIPIVVSRPRSAIRRSSMPWPERSDGAGIRRAMAIRASETTTTPLNAAARPTVLASVPITGPNSAPPIAAPSAAPMSPPRRSAGASATIQASPPAHEKAPPTPSTSRARSSSTTLSNSPKASVEAASSASPVHTVKRGPARAASTPPGIDASSMPSG